MKSAERQVIREAINREVRARLKAGKGSPNRDPQLRTGLWFPALQKVQQQHVFSAIRTEYGSVPD